jgi:hypothetical protein
MNRPKPPSDRTRDRVAESDAADGEPMERFKSLTRRLLGVSNKQVQDERRRLDDAKRKRKK